jgi:hypothetical protein
MEVAWIEWETDEGKNLSMETGWIEWIEWKWHGSSMGERT